MVELGETRRVGNDSLGGESEIEIEGDCEGDN